MHRNAAINTATSPVEAQPSRNLFGAFTLALLIGAAAVLAGCNTMEGMGRDVSAAGDTLTDTAEDVQQ
ncbi:MAG TPA: entericidin A/B family lipoprotein [Geminicoccaceae bacterium]|nr:entericidin A/B family lipoprotein [Geminicoccaceae bacterium]